MPDPPLGSPVQNAALRPPSKDGVHQAELVLLRLERERVLRERGGLVDPIGQEGG